MENEKRLIDYQKAIEIAFDTLKGKVTAVTAVMLKTRLKGATVDAVEVVRCNKCTYWDKAKSNKKGFLICPASGMEIKADDFCSYGERREGE